MIAIIEIPHQRDAQLHLYADRSEVIDEALDYAASEGRDYIPEAGYADRFDNAVAFLADDWHGRLVVETANDLECVRQYNGHQNHLVAAMLPELSETFPG